MTKTIKKRILIMILISLCMLLAESFLNTMKNDISSIDEWKNEGYYDYIENTENYTITEAKIIDELYVDTGATIDFFSKTNYWLVEFELPEGQIAQAQVIKDFDNENMGDIIRIAYKKDYKTYHIENITTTRLEYMESVTEKRSVLILSVAVFVVLIACLSYSVFLWLKLNRIKNGEQFY
ncbi:MAG: hypothetical protein E7505_05540 [Ruminococcus sp.]|nr:hypothetical protein [Ruminococcus sp.]